MASVISWPTSLDSQPVSIFRDLSAAFGNYSDDRYIVEKFVVYVTGLVSFRPAPRPTQLRIQSVPGSTFSLGVNLPQREPDHSPPHSANNQWGYISTPPYRTALPSLPIFIYGLGYLSRYSDSLRAGRSGDRIPVVARFFAPVQTGPGAHPASYTMGTGSLPRVKRQGRGADHPPHLAPKVKKE
jgi:hypothetical protein